MDKFDLAVIGSGPGGYITAIRNAQLGKKVALIEKYTTLGGACLNVGCIPSKALLDSSEHFHNAQKTFAEHGIDVKDPKVNFAQMIERKRQVVRQTTDGIQYLMKKNNITVFHGSGKFKNKTQIEINNSKSDPLVIETEKTIIATGSKPSDLPFLKIDKNRIISSTEALELTEIPKHLIIIGGGIIGLELGSIYKRIGSDVTVVEYMDRILPTMDSTMSKELAKSIKKLGVKLHLSTKVTGAKVEKNQVTVTAENKKGQSIEINGDYCLMAVGRKPYTEGLGLENIGIEVSERGFIKTNQHFQTNVDNIFAIGDVIGGAMLAHKAEEEGVVLAEYLNGERSHMDYNLIPGIVYTWPEVASVGATEEQLKEKGKEYKIGSFPMRALGRSRASMDIEGVVKILADKQTDEIFGVHIVGARAADLIMEAAVAMEFRASAEDLSRICHGHPTYSEAMKEAALDAWNGKPLNI